MSTCQRIVNCVPELLAADNEPCVLGDGSSTKPLVADFLRRAVACTDSRAQISARADGAVVVPFTTKACKATSLARKLDGALPCVTRHFDTAIDNNTRMFATFPVSELQLDRDGRLGLFVRTPNVAEGGPIKAEVKVHAASEETNAAADAAPVAMDVTMPPKVEDEDVDLDLHLTGVCTRVLRDKRAPEDDTHASSEDTAAALGDAERSRQIRDDMTSRWRGML